MLKFTIITFFYEKRLHNQSLVLSLHQIKTNTKKIEIMTVFELESTNLKT
jgi:hypothetical protein